MKTFRTLLLSMALFVSAISASAQPMSFYAIRDNARFLTDRMVYTLGIASELIDDLYAINYDYIYGVNDYLDDVALGYRYDDYMAVMEARDLALRRLLTYSQWRRLMEYDYFYRPIVFGSNRWYFSIYRHDPHVGHFYYAAPPRYVSYRGGHFFGGMDPRGGHAPGHPGGAHRGYSFDRPNNPGGGQPGMGQPNGNRGYGNNRGTFNRGNNGGGNPNGNMGGDNRGNNAGSVPSTNFGNNRGSASMNTSRGTVTGSRGSSMTRPSSGNSRSSATRSSSSVSRSNGTISRSNGTISRSSGSVSRGSGSVSRSSGSVSRGSGSATRSSSSSTGGASRGGGRR